MRNRTSAQYQKPCFKDIFKKVQAFINKCIERTMRIWWLETIRNEELWERTGQEPAKCTTSRRKWAWIGHTLRKPKKTSPNSIYLAWNPSGKQNCGRPRHTWRREMEAEMATEGFKLKRLENTCMTQNCVRWKLIVDGLYFATG